MSGRLEYKYLVPNDVLPQLRNELRPYVSDKPAGGSQYPNAYTVRSIYYDTLGFQCYDEKDAGIRVRNKFRIRGYARPNENSIVFLEIKRKDGGFIDKHRAPVLRRDLRALLDSRDIERYVIGARQDEIVRRDAERFLYHYHRFGLHPATLVVYDREAFSSRFDPSLRLTFDKALRQFMSPEIEQLYDEPCLAPTMYRSFVFEVKFFRYALPRWVTSIISRYELPRLALSKYTMCLDTVPSPAMSAQGRGRRFARRLEPIPPSESSPC